MAEYNESWEEGPFYGDKRWAILKCMGCDFVFLCTTATASHDMGYGDDGPEPIERHEYHPPLAKRQRPEWKTDWTLPIDSISQRLDAVLEELYQSLDSGLRILAGIGIRTAFDVASEDLGIDAALAFSCKLEALVDARHIRDSEKERLGILVEVGHGSAHRGFKPSADTLDAMMTILEDFIREAFIVPSRHKEEAANLQRIRAEIPPRRKKLAPPDGLPAINGTSTAEPT